MSDREPIPILCPSAKGKAERQLRAAIAAGLLRKVIQQAVMNRNPLELTLEVYLAGMLHGAETMRNLAGLSREDVEALQSRPGPRVIDRIDVAAPPVKRRRGRPRKVAE